MDVGGFDGVGVKVREFFLSDQDDFDGQQMSGDMLGGFFEAVFAIVLLEVSLPVLLGDADAKQAVVEADGFDLFEPCPPTLIVVFLKIS